MYLLLETHIFYWWATNRRLPVRAAQLIGQADEIYVSSVCIWELAIKARRGKLLIDFNRLIEEIAKAGFHELRVQFSHAALVATLPAIHFDPFDRLLVAQAVCESLLLVTVDKQLPAYSKLVQLV